MGRKNTKGTQKINPIIDASVESPPYETALGMTNTKEEKRGKQDKEVDTHSCKCKNKKTKNVRKRTRTWESIKDLYGDADTTEVWDDRQQKPKVSFSPKLQKNENPKRNIDELENNDVVAHPRSNLENTPAKLSLIGLYRKHKNDRKKIKMKQYANENSLDTDVISSPYSEPKVKFLLPKKSKKVKPNYTKSNYAKPNYATGDICTQGPCREALENLYHLQGLKYNPYQQDSITYDRTKSGYKDTSKKQKDKTKTPAKENKVIKKSKIKQVKAIKTTKGGNVGYGDQISPIPLKNQDEKDVLSKYSFIRKKVENTVCKCKNNIENKLQTDSDQISPNSLKKKDLKIIDKMMGNTICKCKNNNGSQFQTDGDQISPVSLKNQGLEDVLNKYSFIRKKVEDTVCKCKNNNGNKLQTDSDQISPNSLKKKDLKIIDKMMGHTICKCKNNNRSQFQTDGDQISPVSLKNQGLEDVLNKYSFIRKKVEDTVCKCKTNNGNKLQTDSDQISPNSLKKKDLKIIDKMMGHTICKCNNNNRSQFQTDGDQITPVSLQNQGLEDLQCKCSFIGKMLGHTICKCKINNGSTLQISSNVNNDNSEKEKKKTKTTIRENKIIKSKNKQAKEIKITKDGNVGYGDQISPIPLKNQDGKDVVGKYSFIDKIMGHTICKCKNNNGITLQTSSNVNNDNIKKEKLKSKTHTRENKNIKKSKKKQAKSIKTTKEGNVDVQSKDSFIGKMVRHAICKCKNNNALQTSNYVNDQTGDPLLKMKVNLTDMRVINSSEVNEKIRKLGRTKKHMSCICPSNKIGKACERGPCINALDNPYSNFDCKCQKQKIIDCKDSTCDLQIGDIKVRSRIKKQKPQSSVYNKDKKPLFELMLDPGRMKIMNSKELKDIIRQTSQNKMICPTGICKTMSKQRNAQMNCKCVAKKLSPYINDCEERTCRVFSKSERYRKRRPIRGNGHGRNGVMINLPRGRTPKKGTDEEEDLSDVLCKCKEKKPEKKKTIKKRRRRRRRGLFRRKKKDYRTFKEKILDCLEREQEECEYRVMRKTKEYKKNEKKAIKENKKMLAAQKKAFKANSHNASCFINFISGFLNVAVESVITAFKITFSVIGDPVSSYVYVREKVKNPPAAIIRIFEWLVRTWGNKTTAVAKAVEESGKLKVIADQIEDSAVYNYLACRSPAKKIEHEKRARIRKRRMQKRHDEALYGCRHMMLTTIRKTPCLWFYHICPDLYPQCLGLLSFMTNFLHILLYCGAVMCWTPCIVFCEMCRAFMCCFLCTH